MERMPDDVLKLLRDAEKMKDNQCEDIGGKSGFWEPEEGDTVTGKVLEFRPPKTEDSSGFFRVLTVDAVVLVNAHFQILEAYESGAFVIGDIIRVRYSEEKRREGGKSIKLYELFKVKSGRPEKKKKKRVSK